MTVRLRRFTDPGLFLEHCSACLATHEAENNLPLGILANLLAGQYKEFPPYMAAVECDRSIVQVLLRTPPHPLLISYRDTPPSDEVVRLVVEDLRREYGDELAGMTGDKDVVSSYVKAWEHTSARQARLRTAMRVYRASQIRPIMGVLGIMRPITEADGELVVEWLLAFNRETHNEEPARDRVYATFERYLSADRAQRGLVLWEVGGAPVSMAGYSGPTPHGIRVGPVYTPPSYRRRGYASACVGALSQHLLAGGRAFCFLFADLRNPTSNHIYQELGYTPVSDVDSYLFL
ncbi:MAG: GNAT family N-acetyltransferase [Limnochordia bacterium]